MILGGGWSSNEARSALARPEYLYKDPIRIEQLLETSRTGSSSVDKELRLKLDRRGTQMGHGDLTLLNTMTGYS
jgi:hypothetical protein